MTINIKELTTHKLKKLLKDEKFSKFGPSQCSKCHSAENFSRRVFEISGVAKEMKTNDEIQNLIRYHMQQQLAIEWAFFRTHQDRFFADSAKCASCNSTAVVFDILDQDFLMQQLSQSSGKPKAQVEQEFAAIMAKLESSESK